MTIKDNDFVKRFIPNFRQLTLVTNNKPDEHTCTTRG
jgi:hypothetical protein